MLRQMCLVLGLWSWCRLGTGSVRKHLGVSRFRGCAGRK